MMISSLLKRGPFHLPVLSIVLLTLFPAILSAQAAGGAGDDLFETVILLPVEGYIVDLETADVNGDGRPDLVTAENGDYMKIYLGNGDGTFSAGGSFVAGDDLEGLALGDVDGDGHQDAVTISRYSPELRVLLGDGLGGFTEHWTDSSPYYPTALGLDNIGADGDDDLDLVVNWPDDDEIRLFNGVGDGTFTTDGNYAVGQGSNFITFADFSNNGILDVVTANGQDNSVTVLKYTDGNYAHRADYAVGYYPSGLETADLDVDGDEDLAVACDWGGLIILENIGGGMFTSHSTIYGGAPEQVVSADFNLDEIADLAVINDYYPMLSVYIGRGDMTFEEPQDYLTDSRGRDLVVSDFDLDGDPDVAAATEYEGYIAVFLNGALGPGYIVTGPGRGESNPPLARVFDPVNVTTAVAEWMAYGADSFGVNVACGDLDLDQEIEVLTGPGPGEIYGPQVRGFRFNGSPIAEISFQAYGTLKFGVNVACGDLDGDDYPEIITGAGPGEVFGPHVRGWNWDGDGEVTAIPEISFMAYGAPQWGVNVAGGDIDGDGFAEIVTGAGPGAIYGPHVRGWNWDGSGVAEAIPQVSFLAYGTNQFGVNVACGDIDGDGTSEIVTGAGPGVVFGPHVRGWSWDGSGPVESVSGVNFLAYPTYTQWGVNVGCGDVDGDGIDEILTGPGPGEDHFPWVRGFNYDGAAVTAVPGIDFLAYNPDDFSHGVKVAGAGSR